MGLITGGSFLKLGHSIWVMHVLKINIRHNANLINKDESTMKTKNAHFQCRHLDTGSKCFHNINLEF